MNDELKQKFIGIMAKEGWHKHAMPHASILSGLHPEYHNILFPGGITEALDFYEQALDEEMLYNLNNYDPLPQKIREKIALALKLRIVTGHIPSIKFAWRTAGKIWKFAGDKSIDFNYYSKRGLLAHAYIAAAKFRSSDRSIDAIAMDIFIAKKLDSIISIAQLKNKLPKIEDIPVLRYFI